MSAGRLHRNDPYRDDLERICRTLVSHYPTANWWPARSRFEVMAGAILVQNTRWANVAAAIGNLRNAGCLTPAAMAAKRAKSLSRLIRPAGFHRVKAHRLRSLARWVLEQGGIREIARHETVDLRRGLIGVHGVGPETADAILCFAFARASFVADAYARRWLSRIGYAAHDTQTYERCRSFVECRLEGDGEAWQALHAAIVLHAQAVCGRRPDCAACPVQRVCKYYLKTVN